MHPYSPISRFSDFCIFAPPQILAAVSTVFPSSRVGVRLSPNGAFNCMGGADNHATFTYALSQLQTLGLAYVHVMDGLAFGFHGKCAQLTLCDARKVIGDTLHHSVWPH
jgi:hypothetical protein